MAARPQIKLNGVALPPQMIAAEAQHHPARTPAAAFQAAARALVVRTLLLEEARRRGLEATPDLVAPGKRETQDEAVIRALLDGAAPIPEPSEAACRAFYDSHRDKFCSPDLMEASHILFAADPHDAAAHAKAEAQARVALEEIARRPQAFDAIARERSDCPSKSAGGRLGQLQPGELVREFEAALCDLEPGETGREPVATRFGLHVVRLDARVRGQLLPFDYVRDRIAAFLAERQWRRETSAFIAGLVEGACIEGLDMASGAEAAAS